MTPKKWEVKDHRKYHVLRIEATGEPVFSDGKETVHSLPGGLRGKVVKTLTSIVDHSQVIPVVHAPMRYVFQLEGVADDLYRPVDLWPLYPEVFRIFTLKELGWGWIEVWSIFTYAEDEEMRYKRNRAIK